MFNIHCLDSLAVSHWVIIQTSRQISGLLWPHGALDPMQCKLQCSHAICILARIQGASRIRFRTKCEKLAEYDLVSQWLRR